MIFLPQLKGKDIDKVALSKLRVHGWYPSIKYDGNYVQIGCEEKKINFTTSGGKSFYLEKIAKEFNTLANIIRKHTPKDLENTIHIETEYIGHTDGRLGSRRKCQGDITSWRSQYSKEIKSTCGYKNSFVVFDFMHSDIPYEVRKVILDSIDYSQFDYIQRAVQISSEPMSLNDARKIRDEYLELGWEGLVLVQGYYVYDMDLGRTNDIIKLKEKPTADLLCVDTKLAEEGSQFDGLIGSLVCKDSKGRVVDVGSGLNRKSRELSRLNYIGKVIEIKYESMSDVTYQQPIFVGVRLDKEPKDIN